MSRKRVASTAAILALLAATPVAASATPHPTTTGADETGPTVSQLAPGVSLLIGQDGNVVLVSGPRGVLVIDDQRRRSVPAVVAAASGPITHAINTHWHQDHSGGNATLAEAGAEIIAHRSVRARLSADQFMAAYNQSIPASAPIAWPTVVFEDGLTVHHGDETLHLVHTPAAHTDGDIIVRLERANVLHMGDLFFNGLFPFIDRSSGGTIDGLIAAIDRAIALSDAETRVIPSHGAPSDRDGLIAWRSMLSTLRERVAARVAAGETIEQIIALGLTADYPLGGDADRFVMAIHDSLPH